MKKIIILLFILIFLISLNIFFYQQINQTNSNILKVAFLDIGQGDGIFIETPNKKQILIDAGPDSKILRSIKNEIPFYDRSLDLLIASHYDLDHIGGFSEVFKRFNVKSFGHYAREEEGEYVDFLKTLITDENLEYEYELFAGQEFILDAENNITLKILWPPKNYSNDDRNNSSVIVKLIYNQVSVLLTGDAGIEIENYLINYFESSEQNLKSNILKAGHHGSKTSSGINFLEKVKPEYSIISAGLNNKFNHPDQEVIDNLNQINTKILNTANSGSIVFETNGEVIWLVE